MSEYNFDRHVAQIGRRRAVAFFVPRLVGLAIAAYLIWRFL